MKLKVSGSYRRYLVVPGACERSPDPLERGLEKAIFEKRFRSIDRAASEIRSFGWSDTDGLLPAKFEELDLWVGAVLRLGLRVDTKRIPAGAFRVRRLELEARERREVGERIPPDRRREMRETLESELLTQTIPSTAVYQMLWDTRSGQVLLSTTADAPNGAFVSLFRDTFGRALLPVTPGSLAMTLARELRRKQALDALMPVTFTG